MINKILNGDLIGNSKPLLVDLQTGQDTLGVRRKNLLIQQIGCKWSPLEPLGQSLGVTGIKSHSRPAINFSPIRDIKSKGQ